MHHLLGSAPHLPMSLADSSDAPKDRDLFNKVRNMKQILSRIISQPSIRVQTSLDVLKRAKLPLEKVNPNINDPLQKGWSSTNLGKDLRVSNPSDIHTPASKAFLNGVTNMEDPTYSPDGSNLVKLVLLGSPGVGKTSIIQQFVWGTFEPAYLPTERKETYYPSVILNDHNYELKIVDIPDLPFFPVNSFYNLSDLQRKKIELRIDSL
ncbi:RASL10B [Lepeophtheirus salmonis]|uniref:RASL10B n=1 Tax=Lepeophtheirus salmonis TaxID=72036 RepID=A0A7R8CLG2_LEPSM|nr:RASL10B [Lepeophtheirus salmonis]CAF2854986.1 RASL10B [Lepeophtheirus salmonis]